MQKWVPKNLKKSCKRFICFLSLCVIGWNHIISIFSIWRQTYHGRTTSNVVVDADIHATLTKKMPQNCINLTFKKNRMIWGWHLAHGMHVQYMFIITKGHKKLWQTGYHSYTREDMFSRVWPWSKQKTTVSECSTFIKYFWKLKLFLSKTLVLPNGRMHPQPSSTMSYSLANNAQGILLTAWNQIKIFAWQGNLFVCCCYVSILEHTRICVLHYINLVYS